MFVFRFFQLSLGMFEVPPKYAFIDTCFLVLLLNTLPCWDSRTKSSVAFIFFSSAKVYCWFGCTADLVWWYWGILTLTLTLWQLSLLPAAFLSPSRTTPSFSRNLCLLSRNPWVLPAVFPPIKDPLRNPSGWFLCRNIFWNDHSFSQLL